MKSIARIALGLLLALQLAQPAWAAKYAMSKVSPFNQHDQISSTNPLNISWVPIASWRYGNWGGFGWTNGQESTAGQWNGVATAWGVDAMDNLFKQHDTAYRQAQLVYNATWYLPLYIRNQVRNTSLTAADNTLRNGLRALPNATHSVWGSIYFSMPGGSNQFMKVDARTTSIMRYGTSLANYTFGTKDMPASEYARREAISAFTTIIASRLAGLSFN